MTSDPQPMRRRPVAAVSFLVLGFFLYKLAPTQADPDLWGHVTFGGDLLRTGQFARPDVYSYASGVVPWINHELLAEVALHLSWTLGGGTGLVALKVLVGMSVAGALWLHMLRAGLEAVRSGIVLIAASFALLPSLGTVRPQMFTVLLFTVLLLVLHAADRDRPELLWTVPLVLAVWVNFHGGVLAGLALVLVYAAASLLVRLRRGLPVPLVLWILPLAAVAALAVNPYGLRLPEFLLRTATVPRPEITEWGPVSLLAPDGAAYLVLLAVTGGAIVRRAGRASPALIAVYAAAALAPLTAVRHVALFAVTAIVVGAEPLAAAWRDLRGARRGDADEDPVAEGPAAQDPVAEEPAAQERAGLFERGAGRWALVAGGAAFLALALPHFRTVQVGPAFEFPARAIDRLARSGVEARLAIDFDWGQYALWHLHPDVLVAPDGRRETVYDEATYRRYLAFAFGAGDWDRFLEDPAADLALVPAGAPPANLLALDDGWRVVHEDATAVLFARAGFAETARIAATAAREIPPDGAGLEFPGP